MPAPTISNGPVFHCKTDGRPGRDARRSRYHASHEPRRLCHADVSRRVPRGDDYRRVAIAAQEAPPAAANIQDRFPEATGKAALLKVCSNCHTAESVVQSLRTRQEWSDVVDQMSRYGARGERPGVRPDPLRTREALLADLDQQGDREGSREHARRSGKRGGSDRRDRTEKGDFKSIED